MFFNKFIAPTLATYIMLIGVAKAYSGDATWYHTGVGNCGATSQESDYIVALSTADYDGGSHCYKHIEITYNGKTIDATVVDSCPGCPSGSIDLSPGAFEALAPLDAGQIPVTWQYA